jgi:hypothetical protein
METKPQDVITQPASPITPNQHINLLPVIITGLLMFLLGLGCGYLLFANKGQTQQVSPHVSPAIIQQVSPTSISSPTAIPTSPITKSDTTSVSQNGITLTISPTHGPAGTKVTINIIGIVGNPNGPYANISFLAINGLGKDSTTTTYTFDTTKISQSGAYKTTYVIPNTVLTYDPSKQGEQNPTLEVPIGIGNGNITFSYDHPTFHDISIKAPFTVTSN